MTDNNSYIIKNLLSPKEFRKCEIIFNGDKNFKKGWNCFNNGVSWIQFFHDILLLCNGIRSAVLIDYAVPEWDDLCEFLNHIKSSTILSNIIGKQLSNIQLIHLDDYLFFIVNLETLVEKSKVDINNSFTNYLFIDVSTHNVTPIICNDPINHHQLLSKLINIINKTGTGTYENIILSNKENTTNLSLTKQYYPIISGWLCEYPIIYCNSGCFKQCCLIDTNGSSEIYETLLKDWENNNLCGDELIKFEVSIKELNNQNYISIDILKIQSIQRICSFTYPVSICKEMIDGVLTNYENRINKRFNSSQIFKELWLSISFIKQTISMTTIRL